ncbi:MAG: hypothetical protein ACOVLC_13435 [Flavobacterium sp.]
MTYLKELTPAEVYVLMNQHATHSAFLKITFVDLLLKQVLKISEVERQPNIREEVRIYKYVGIGVNFKEYKSKNHEKYFLSTFEEDNSFEILFSNLVKISYQKSHTLRNFKNEVIKTPTLRKCTSQNLFQKIFLGFGFTDYGGELKRKVEKELQTLNAAFSDVKTIEQQKVIDLIKVIGGNIFLLDNISYEILDQFGSGLSTELNRMSKTEEGSGCLGYNMNFDHYSSSFDSGCSSDAGSGCGSGCSGCGGCG